LLPRLCCDGSGAATQENDKIPATAVRTKRGACQTKRKQHKKNQYKQRKQGQTRNSNKYTYQFFDGSHVQLQQARKDLDSVEAQALCGEGFANSFTVGHEEYGLIFPVGPIFM
jgi:hypothetical protein